MPNWTHNRVRVRGDDSEKIQEIKKLFEGKNPFHVLIPEPHWATLPLTEEYLKSYSFSEPKGQIGELPVQPDPDKKEWDCPKFASTGRQDDRWYEWSPPEPIVHALRSKYECKDEGSYSNGKYLSVSWLYELEGEEGVGYL